MAVPSEKTVKVTQFIETEHKSSGRISGYFHTHLEGFKNEWEENIWILLVFLERVKSENHLHEDQENF